MADERSRSPLVLAAGPLCVCTLLCSPALAIVGPDVSPATDDGFVMVLSRGTHESGFCSGIVLAPDVVLTAAHCVRAPADTRVLVAGTNPPTLIEADRIVVHPDYHPRAATERQRSVDVALVRLAQSLPSQVHPVQLADERASAPDTRIVGFGLSDERNARTGGHLRAAAAPVRPPLSALLLWLAGPNAACTGDSGGGVLDRESGRLIGVIAWAQGVGRKTCGTLTQAIRIDAVLAWIDATRTSWR